MRLFVSEFLTCGACPETAREPSLLREGRSMVEAVLADFVRCDDCHVVTTWDSQLGPLQLPGVEIIPVSNRSQEEACFAELAADCDATFLIAPETDGVLARRRSLVEELGGRSLGCSAAAIQLCGSKLAVADLLESQRIATIKTAPFSPHDTKPPFHFPVVVKPDDGAGSLDTFLVDDDDGWLRVRAAFGERDNSPQGVVQPFIPGTAFSVAAIVSGLERVRHKRSGFLRRRYDVGSQTPLGSRHDHPGGDLEHILLPPVLQHLTINGRFQYLGGSLPAGFERTVQSRIAAIVDSVCRSIPGLGGYVGFDMVLPETSPDPLIVEINPRLTTSYLGYRALTDENLAERLLNRDQRIDEVRWKPLRVGFTPQGTVSIQEHAVQD